MIMDDRLPSRLARGANAFAVVLTLVAVPAWSLGHHQVDAEPGSSVCWIDAKKPQSGLDTSSEHLQVAQQQPKVRTSLAKEETKKGFGSAGPYGQGGPEMMKKGMPFFAGSGPNGPPNGWWAKGSPENWKDFGKQRFAADSRWPPESGKSMEDFRPEFFKKR